MAVVSAQDYNILSKHSSCRVLECSFTGCIPCWRPARNRMWIVTCLLRVNKGLNEETIPFGANSFPGCKHHVPVSWYWSAQSTPLRALSDPYH